MNQSVKTCSRTGQQVFLALLATILFLPFMDKAFHIDDPFYLWIARHILEHPLDFFGFSANWYGVVKPMAALSANPPLFSYYLAPFGYFFGWSERVMHAAQLVPAVAFILGIYHLAGRFQSPPLLASLLAMITPVYLLCGTSVMLDMPMSALYVWVLYFWLKGLEPGEGGWKALLAASFLTVAAGVTKYFAISLLPLMAVVPLSKRLPLRKWLPFLLLPLVMFLLFEWWTSLVYGIGHVTSALNFASQGRESRHTPAIKSFLDTLSFLGGGLGFSIVLAPVLLRSKDWLRITGALAVPALLIWLIRFHYREGFLESPAHIVQLLVFAAGGMGVLVAVLTDFRRLRGPESLMLICWVAGVFIFAAFMNPFVAGRYLLPLVPPTAIVFAARLSSLTGWRQSGAVIAGGALLALSLSAVRADYLYANEVRSASGNIQRLWRETGGGLYFLGHWGMQYYLEEIGGIAVDRNAPQLRSGDLLVRPTFGTNNRPLDLPCTHLGQFDIAAPPWLTTFNPFTGAGFHTGLSGPLPYSFGTAPPDYLDVCRVI